MAEHRYVFNVLFDDDDEDDDDVDNDEYKEDNIVPTTGFRVRNPPPQPKHLETEPQELQVTQKKIKEIENRTLMSACRSIAILQETEDLGIQTAMTLENQGEQLRNTNSKLDGIITNLNISQRHINGIKSVFSGIKHYVFGKSDDHLPPPKEALPNKRSPVLGRNRFGNTKDDASQRKINNYESHPVARLHELDGASSAGPSSSSAHVTQILDDHLHEIDRHIHNLKGLGLELGKKIDEHNELIDIIQNKTEVADIKIGKQNKEMNKILGK